VTVQKARVEVQNEALMVAGVSAAIECIVREGYSVPLVHRDVQLVTAGGVQFAARTFRLKWFSREVRVSVPLNVTEGETVVQCLTTEELAEHLAKIAKNELNSRG